MITRKKPYTKSHKRIPHCREKNILIQMRKASWSLNKWLERRDGGLIFRHECVCSTQSSQLNEQPRGGKGNGRWARNNLQYNASASQKSKKGRKSPRHVGEKHRTQYQGQREPGPKIERLLPSGTSNTTWCHSLAENVPLEIEYLIHPFASLTNVSSRFSDRFGKVPAEKGLARKAFYEPVLLMESIFMDKTLATGTFVCRYFACQ